MSINSIKSYHSEQSQTIGSLTTTTQMEYNSIVSRVTQYNILGTSKDSISISRAAVSQIESGKRRQMNSEQSIINNADEAMNAVKSILTYLKSNGSNALNNLKYTSSNFV